MLTLELMIKIEELLHNLGFKIDLQSTLIELSKKDEASALIFKFIREVKPLIEQLNQNDPFNQIEKDYKSIKQEMRTFIKDKRRMINESNVDEFTVAPGQRQGAARVDTFKIDRKKQISLNLVHNSSGPLERSTFRKNTRNAIDPDRNVLNVLFKERIENLEEHLGVATGPYGNIFQRIKRLENRIVAIEQEWPAFAAVHFDQTPRDFSRDQLFEAMDTDNEDEYMIEASDITETNRKIESYMQKFSKHD